MIDVYRSHVSQRNGVSQKLFVFVWIHRSDNKQSKAIPTMAMDIGYPFSPPVEYIPRSHSDSIHQSAERQVDCGSIYLAIA